MSLSTTMLKPFWITCFGYGKLGNDSSWSISKLLCAVTLLLKKGNMYRLYVILFNATCFA